MCAKFYFSDGFPSPGFYQRKKADINFHLYVVTGAGRAISRRDTTVPRGPIQGLFRNYLHHTLPPNQTLARVFRKVILDTNSVLYSMLKGTLA
jgi:hypothetical protein